MAKTAGQSFKKSVIIEGFADRGGDGKKTKAKLVESGWSWIAGSLKIYSR
jgi:hypothetical protein